MEQHDNCNNTTPMNDTTLGDASHSAVSVRPSVNKVDKAAMSQWVTLMDFTEAPIGLFVDQGVLYRMFREYCPPASRLSDPPTEFDRSMFARYCDLQYSMPIHQSISRAKSMVIVCWIRCACNDMQTSWMGDDDTRLPSSRQGARGIRWRACLMQDAATMGRALWCALITTMIQLEPSTTNNCLISQ